MTKSVLIRHILPAVLATAAMLTSAQAADPIQLITREEAGLPTTPKAAAGTRNLTRGPGIDTLPTPDKGVDGKPFRLAVRFMLLGFGRGRCRIANRLDAIAETRTLNLCGYLSTSGCSSLCPDAAGEPFRPEPRQVGVAPRGLDHAVDQPGKALVQLLAPDAEIA